jgi:serine/threonine-protein kinase GIN4
LEYLQGGELFDLVTERQKLSEPEAVRIFSQILSGVSFCHLLGICHRDLKLENIILDKNVNAKIADFGMAIRQPTGRLLRTSCGSPHYAAPEVVSGNCYDGFKSDMWSCGVILFAILTGHLPFDDEDISKLLRKVQIGIIAFGTARLSLHAQHLLAELLQVDPAVRLPIHGALVHPLLSRYSTLKQFRDCPNVRLWDNLVKIETSIMRSLKVLFVDLTDCDLVEQLKNTRYALINWVFEKELIRLGSTIE